jgi:prolyl-tRNA editing enzyme YbaK/EbsC (Cys-tRNA(Pro) deacylase)
MSKAPSTAATRLLREAGVPYTEHLYRYEERGGTVVSARELGVDEHAVVKTLVLEDDGGAPLVVMGSKPLGQPRLGARPGDDALHHAVGGRAPDSSRKT